MSLLNGELVATQMKPPCKAARKGAKFFSKGKPIQSNPYTNKKRRLAFEFGWYEAEEYSKWEFALHMQNEDSL